MTSLAVVQSDDDLVPMSEAEQITGHTRGTLIRRILEQAIPATVVRERARVRYLMRRGDLIAYMAQRGLAVHSPDAEG